VAEPSGGLCTKAFIERNRYGPMASNRLRGAKAVLKMDADEAMRRGVRTYLQFIGRHRAVTYPLVLAGTAGVFFMLWRLSGPTVAVVVVGLCLVYSVGVGVPRLFE
jgi:hypothetical protein